MKKKTLAFLTVALLLIPVFSNASSVIIAWNQSPDPVTGYKIFYGEQSVLINPSIEIDVGNVLQTTIFNLVNGQTYYFALKAYNAYGQSGFSNEVTYTVPVDQPGQVPIVPVLRITNP